MFERDNGNQKVISIYIENIWVREKMSPEIYEESVIEIIMEELRERLKCLSEKLG